MDQVIQVAGALLILVGYAASQFGWLEQTSRAYLVVNLAGSAILGYLALVEEQFGFVLLETVWAAVSLWGLIRGSRAPSSAAS